MKKILIIIPSIKLGGGAEKIASILASELLNAGHNVSIANFYKFDNKYPFSGQRFFKWRNKSS